MIITQKHLGFYGSIAEINELTAHGDVDDFNTTNATTDLFKIKGKITGETGNDGTKNVEIMVPLKYLNNFWRTLEMTLKNCEINLDLNWSKTAV